MAIRLGSFESAKYFIDRGANLEAYCKNKTPLMYTIQYNRLDIFKDLLEKGANPKFTIEGKNALDFTVGYERTGMEMILKEQIEN